MGSGLKLTKYVSHISGLLFSIVPVTYVLCNFGKNGLGYILGDFFTKSSGHPEPTTHRGGALIRPTKLPKPLPDSSAGQVFHQNNRPKRRFTRNTNFKFDHTAQIEGLQFWSYDTKFGCTT
jgi:hypothetical protein